MPWMSLGGIKHVISENNYISQNNIKDSINADIELFEIYFVGQAI